MSGIDLSSVVNLAEPKLEALVELMLLAASADGELAEVELAHFTESVRSLTNGTIVGERLDTLVQRTQAAIEEGGRDAMLASVRERLPDPSARKVALTLAIQVVAADGIIRTSERELVFETAEALGIDGDTAADLVRDFGAR